MNLWLLRHAQPLIAPGVCYGQLDVAADPVATAACARQLAEQLPGGVHVVSSPLQRCELLAQALCALRPDLAHKNDPRLKEMDFGRWEGRAWHSIDPAQLSAWTDEFAHYRVGHDGESVSVFMARVAAVFDALQGGSGSSGSSGASCSPCPQNVLWITHAGVMRAVELLRQNVRQVKRASQWPASAPNYGQWLMLDLSAPAPSANNQLLE